VLAGVLGKLYEREADPAVLTELIAAYQQAAGHAELAGDPAVAAHWNSLGAWLSELYECTGDTGALSDASRADRTRRSRDYRCFPRGNRIARCYAPAAGSLPALADVLGRAYPHRAVTSRGSACGRGGDTRPGG
jgi:hypothetical protein